MRGKVPSPLYPCYIAIYKLRTVFPSISAHITKVYSESLVVIFFSDFFYQLENWAKPNFSGK